MSVWETPEQTAERKRSKCAKNAAYALGGGVGLLVLNLFLPDFASPGAEKLRGLFPLLSGWMILYGFLALGLILFARDKALILNAVLVWLVTPCVLLYIAMQLWQNS